MVPESTPVCFRCKMCKKCFTTMSDINCHLKATNHYIRNSPNNNNNNLSSSTKEKSSNVTSSGSQVVESEDKPLNLSSKAIFTPSRGVPVDKIDLSVSSKGCISVETKQQNGKDKVKVKTESSGKEEGPRMVSSRKSSREDIPPANSDIATATETKSGEDTAEIETDTVTSTSESPPPPGRMHEKSAVTVVTPVDTNEAESTQFVDVEGDSSSEEACTTTTQSPGEKAEETKSKCDDNEDMEVTSEKVMSPPEVPISEMATQVVPMDIEKPEENQSPGGQSSENENKAPPVKKQAEKRERKGGKKKYRCKHCGEKFTFPVQVLMHMRKVHSSSMEEAAETNNNNTKPIRRRSSANSPANNNNNDTTIVNVQMYPLRSHYARAKRRTRSMVSDNGAPGPVDIVTRRSSCGQKVNQVNSIKKKSTTAGIVGARKAITFTCKHCSKKFPLLNHLKIHLHKIHPEKIKKNAESGSFLGGSRKRKLTAAQRLSSGASKRQRRTTTGSFTTPDPAQLESETRSLRVSTRSVSRSVDSEGESGRMSTRRTSLARSDKSGGLAGSSRASSRRSSTKKEHPVEIEKEEEVVVETTEQVEENEDNVEEKEEGIEENEESFEEKVEEETGLNVDSGYIEERMEENDEEEEEEEEGEEEEHEEDSQLGESNNNKGEDEYNDEDCRIIDTVETILYALTSKRSQTCPNCNKYCKFAGNFKLHLKACLNLDDDMEMREGEGEPSFRQPVPFKTELAEEEDEEVEENDEDEEETDPEGEEYVDALIPAVEHEEFSENEVEQDSEMTSPSVPYYQKLEYRRCWECGFVVSKFHNLSRHLKQRHNISMGTKEMHAKQSEVLRLQHNS